MKQVTVLTFLAMLIFSTGCTKVFPEGPAIKETRETAAFSQIEATFSGDVIFTQSAIQKVEVVAAQNILPYIITETIGDKLILTTKPNVSIRGGRVTIYVSGPHFSGAVLTGSGNFTATHPLSGNAIELKVTGSGDVDIPGLTATRLTAQIAGSGNIVIDGGTLQRQELTITGNGDYHAVNMKSDEARVKISGSGEARLWVMQHLDVTISGSGDVRYKGSPDVTSSVSGSGRIRKI